MNTISVIGANGMLGFAVAEYFESRGYAVQRITHDQFDIVKDPIVNLEKMLFETDVVVNCAGITKEKVRNNSVEDVLKINSIFPRNLTLYCKQAGIKCFHITSESVFSGQRGSYSEDDPFDADDFYSISKNAGECPNCMILRTSFIGEEREDSHSLVEWAKGQHGQTVDGLVNHFWNGVTTVYLAEIIEKILENGAYSEGIFHIYSPNIVSKKELMELLNDVFMLNMSIEPIEGAHYCDRTLTSKYSLSRFFCTKTIQMQVHEMKEFFELIRTPVITY